MNGRETFKSWRSLRRWLSWGLLATFFLLVDIAAGGGGPWTLALAVVAGVLVVRTLLEVRTRVVLDEDAFTVIGPWRRLRARWSTFDRIELRRSAWGWQLRLCQDDRFTCARLTAGNALLLASRQIEIQARMDERRAAPRGRAERDGTDLVEPS